ncbi:hypothetical protein Sjap_010091 [Stephania japonica]|uniref:Kinesin-like protein n=1 Tax=Stephania japonica TaxID=461633 RepID=A0AAP0J8Y8_9MAGN
MGEEAFGLESMEAESGVQGEKIQVSVRLRPLSDKEIARNEVSDWECINDSTIIFRNTLSERSMHPTAYTFDRVFQTHCTTKQVYEEAAKRVALSVVSGINSTIFAYGQTSSGKTYTMTGITEYTVADIFNYIQRHEERAFVLKFSAMEIYNEAVRDLLSSESMPLRVLDDPEKGTIVEKLTEETLRDWNHLQELLQVCEAQRKIGETLLNETSSRSHQILRLTIESSACEFLGKDNSSTLAASVNFVDLAGSERASQALSAGARLKEGCHINRSLLSLGTVIRKLSKGRNGHVPYRDSKLTRILQPSLGGNARTAIICTLSPARSHVEQSRNTLLFASCAKEVTVNAQVNVVMSDKALVRHLQRELARLENELKGPGPTICTSDMSVLLRERDRQIDKMEKEIKELTRQRDLAQSRLEDLLQVVGDDRASRQWSEFDRPSKSCVTKAWGEDENSNSELSVNGGHQSSDFGFTRFNHSQYSNGHGSSKNERGTMEDFDDLCKEVRCIEMEESSTNKNIEFSGLSNVESEEVVSSALSRIGDAINQEFAASQQNDDDALHDSAASTYSSLQQKLQNMPKTYDFLFKPYRDEPSPWMPATDLDSLRNLKLTRSRSCRAALETNTSKTDENENTPPNEFEKDFPGRPEGLKRKIPALSYGAKIEKFNKEDCQTSEHSASEDEGGQNIKTSVSGEEDVSSITSFVAGLKEMAKQEYDNQDQEAESKSSEAGRTVKDVGLDPMHDILDSPSGWHLDFKRQQMEIIELWHNCNVSLVHRTYFYLLFKGDPTDRIYLEVELRRLYFLKDTFSHKNLGKLVLEGGHEVSPASSARALSHERRMLCKRMHRKLSEQERESLYQKWGIELDSKQRRLQLAYRIWTNTKDMEHIMESALLVAKLVGLLKPGQAPKEMFGLSFTPQSTSRRFHSWKYNLSSLL